MVALFHRKPPPEVQQLPSDSFPLPQQCDSLLLAHGEMILVFAIFALELEKDLCLHKVRTFEALLCTASTAERFFLTRSSVDGAEDL